MVSLVVIYSFFVYRMTLCVAVFFLGTVTLKAAFIPIPEPIILLHPCLW